MTITIHLDNLGIVFPHKVCFEGFSAQIHHGSRIALIGNNGCGKSSLLKALQGKFAVTSGTIRRFADLVFGYVPQVIEDFTHLSGGQRLNKLLTKALSADPNVLLLDEPTNHLDEHNRKSLMRMLKQYQGTLIVATHDLDLLHHCVNTLWHIDDGKVHVFTGDYEDYLREINIKRASIEREISRLDLQKKDAHQALMQEQERASKRKQYGEKKYSDDKLALRGAQEKGQNTHSKNKASISSDKASLLDQLNALRLPEIIKPKFSLKAADLPDRILMAINDGSVGYQGNPVLQNINLSLGARSRIAIQGDNGSGKTTLIKAIVGDPGVIKSGDWHLPMDIGYLDQHYSTLSFEKSALETIAELVPTWTHGEIRRHLNDFLFRKNTEVETKIVQLSGGEKVRLSLAQIGAKTQKLLVLDEITNNLDLSTKAHVLNFLNAYPGGYIIICHDVGFLQKLHLDAVYVVEGKTLVAGALD